MELDEESLDGTWTMNNKTGIEFFIINDATFTKLCILGDDVEPCFETASIGAPGTLFTKDNDLSDFLQTTSASETYQQWKGFAAAAKWDKAKDILKAMSTVDFFNAHVLQRTLQNLNQLAGAIEQDNGSNTALDTTTDDQQIQKALTEIKEKSTELVETVKNDV